MLKSVMVQVDKESKQDSELFDEHMCFCKTEGGKLKSAIAAAEARQPQLESDLEESTSSIGGLGQTVETQKKELGEAERSLEEAKSLRSQAETSFNKNSQDLRSYIKALESAIKALSSDEASTEVGSLLQRPRSVAALRAAASHVLGLGGSTSDSDSDDGDGEDRDEDESGFNARDRRIITAFLAGKIAMDDGSAAGAGEGGGADLGEVLGICRQMKETMEKELKDAEMEEEKSKVGFGKISTAKNEEISSSKQVIADAERQIGTLKVHVGRLRQDIEDTAKSLAENQELLSNLTKGCNDSKEEYTARQAYRDEEQRAASHAVEILTSGQEMDIADRFAGEATMPDSSAAPSFLQVSRARKGSSSDGIVAALNAVARRSLRGGMASGGKKMNFRKVVELIDQTIFSLERTQRRDDKELAFCKKELSESEAESSALSDEIKDISTQAAERQSSISQLERDIASVVDGIKAQDMEVQEATKQRRTEHDEHLMLLTKNHRAIALMESAKIRLGDVYGHGAGAAALVQKSRRADPSKTVPEGAAERRNSVMGLIEKLQADMDRDSETAKVEEKKAQDDYEAFVSAAAERHATDAERLVQLEAARADSEVRLTAQKKRLKDKTERKGLVQEYLGEMHGQCDNLLQNYDRIKAARDGEVTALHSAREAMKAQG